MNFIKTIPEVILVGSALLVAIALVMWLLMRAEARRLKKELALLRTAWASVEPLSREDRGHGLDGRKFGEIQTKCEGLEGTAKTWWHGVDESLERYTSPEERDGWFLAKPLREVLPESLIGRHFHIS